MNRTLLLWAAAGLVLIANVWALAGVALNRTGEPDAEMELTAREIYYGGGRSEESLASASLRWQGFWSYYPFDDGPGWFDEAKLEELGFDTHVLSGDAARYYADTQSRRAYVALEFDGPAFQQWLKTRAAQNLPGNALDTQSRLVAIDAARTGEILRQRHPDRHKILILPAVVRAQWLGGDRARVVGAITRILNTELHVPQEFAAELNSIPDYVTWQYPADPSKSTSPPYAVTLRVGSRYEPWIAGVRRLR